STAGIAPFGVLPDQDAGRPVLKVATGEVTTTPAATAANSTIRAVSDVTIAADGTAQGSGKVTAAGALGVNVRAMIKSIPTGQDKLLINGLFGPTAEGTLDRGDPFNLTEPYVISATYRVPGAINVPGPGAVPFTLAFKPFSFTEIVGASLPASRNSDYFCPSLTAEEVTTFRFPQGFKLLSIPDSQVLATDGVRLQVDLERKDARTVTQTYTLKIEHPRATCTPEYYAGVRASLAKMANALHEQIIYKGPKAAQ
ncbi:MAG: hypothetical protein KGJ78_14685, partial [Alphaproteobacteria bacterium]|nr:hypothetical protein [Alphaproteobacteria bacterium]